MRARSIAATFWLSAGIVSAPQPVIPGPGGCPSPASESDCRHARTAQDDLILFEPEIRAALLRLWALSRPGAPAAERREAGCLVVRSGGGFRATSVETDGDPAAVELSLRDPISEGRGEALAATVHTHPLGGETERDASSGLVRTWLPCQGALDMAASARTGVPSYVLSREGVYRYRHGRDRAPVAVLCGREFALYMRAPAGVPAGPAGIDPAAVRPGAGAEPTGLGAPQGPKRDRPRPDTSCRLEGRRTWSGGRPFESCGEGEPALPAPRSIPRARGSAEPDHALSR